MELSYFERDDFIGEIRDRVKGNARLTLIVDTIFAGECLTKKGRLNKSELSRRLGCHSIHVEAMLRQLAAILWDFDPACEAAKKPTHVEEPVVPAPPIGPFYFRVEREATFFGQALTPGEVIVVPRKNHSVGRLIERGVIVQVKKTKGAREIRITPKWKKKAKATPEPEIAFEIL